MARLNVNPTRVELRNLQQRLKIASRGHTLLKEKQDALIRRFLQLTEEAKGQRKQLEEHLHTIFLSYQETSILNDDEVLQEVLNTAQEKMTIQIKLENILGVNVPKLQLMRVAETAPLTSNFLAIRQLNKIQDLKSKVQKEMVALAEIEKQCQLLGHEIILTKRRVNSLEFRTIPDLEETIAYITMKIDDNDRNQVAKLIKLKAKE